jgi:hypothetical protein
MGDLRMTGPVLQSSGGSQPRSPEVAATTTGTLSAIDFTGGVPTGAATVLSGPAVDGQSWQPRGLPVLNLHLTASELRPAPPGAGRTRSGILRPVGPCSSRDRAAVS